LFVFAAGTCLWAGSSAVTSRTRKESSFTFTLVKWACAFSSPKPFKIPCEKSRKGNVVRVMAGLFAAPRVRFESLRGITKDNAGQQQATASLAEFPTELLRQQVLNVDSTTKPHFDAAAGSRAHRNAPSSEGFAVAYRSGCANGHVILLHRVPNLQGTEDLSPPAT
jgi:hypothetical protein